MKSDRFFASKVTCLLCRDNHLFIGLYIQQSAIDNIDSKSLIVEFDICTPDKPERPAQLDSLFEECKDYIQQKQTNERIACGKAIKLLSHILADFHQKDGSCVAFDLTEPGSLFANTLQWQTDGNFYPLRTAAYDTSFIAVANKFNTDQLAVVGLGTVLSQIDKYCFLCVFAVHRQSTVAVNNPSWNAPGLPMRSCIFVLNSQIANSRNDP
ncbi:unnamed protein product [Gongylonema pulchrum]|uniref:Protein kinase domain-containing protein n=1 Tax=Gongylonema pulchrum TaxID=637853 RepID=A0A183DYU7_9BILA|nr:unnamed protein product [Gongylonema pulchrum]